MMCSAELTHQAPTYGAARDWSEYLSEKIWFLTREGSDSEFVAA